MNTFTCRKYLIITVLFILLGGAYGSALAGSSLINYQGRLTNADGSPVSNPTMYMEFVLFADSVDGEKLWSEETYVSVADGLFSHMLGSITVMPQSLFLDNDNLFLEIRLASGFGSPARMRLASAVSARVAGSLSGVDDNDILSIIADPGSHVLTIYDTEGNETISFRGEMTGDSSVVLPDSSVNHFEMLDEPGLTMNIGIRPYTLVPMEMTDLLTVEIETPADGYIVVEGKCYVELSGTTEPNTALIQIDEHEGGGSSYPYYSLAGLSGYVNSGSNYFPVYLKRVYWKSAGVYEFRMEGRATNPSPATAKSWDHVLSATFYPTSYGVMSKVTTDVPDHPNVVPVQVVDPQNPDGPDTYYQYDLRQNEKIE